MTLLALGDSLTAGVGDRSDRGGYRGPLYARLRDAGLRVRMAGSQRRGAFEEPACEGHPGWVIAQLHRGVRAGWIEASRPDVILLLIGTNDLHRNEPNASAAGAIDRLMGELRERGRRVEIVDLHSSLSAADLPDGLHPHAEAYGRMAERWAAALLRDGSGSDAERVGEPEDRDQQVGVADRVALRK